MRYLLARLVQGVFTILAVSLITFAIPFINSKPYSLAIKDLGARAKYWEIQQWIRKNGFDDSFWVQYWHWFDKAMHFNFGTAFSYSTLGRVVTVNTILGGALWRSVWLVFVPTLFSILIAVPIGLSQAIKRNKLYDHGMTTVVYVLYSTPAFLVCTLISFYVGDDMKWLGLPPTVNQFAQQVPPHQFPVWLLEHANQFVLPFIAIIVLSVGGLTRFMRGSALDTLVQDHVRTARAKGGSPTRVLFRHVMRPSLIPLITIVGLTLPAIIGGAIIVEEVFNYPGMGVITVQAAEVGDFAIVMAVTIFTAFLTVVGNYLADIFVAIADPRVRLGAAR